MSKSPLHGLYCITDPQLTQQSAYTIEEMVAQAIAGGAKVIQYRDKTASKATQRQTAGVLAQLCHAQNVRFFVNDDPEIARDSDADGVHIGQGDASLVEARRLLGPEKQIGVSCHDSIELALRAQAQGADYIAFGRFFSSQTKPEARPAPLELLTQARAVIKLPIVAIGGITAENSQQLLDQGADMLAVINAVFGQEHIQPAAAKIAQLFEHGTEPA